MTCLYVSGMLHLLLLEHIYGIHRKLLFLFSLLSPDKDYYNRKNRTLENSIRDFGKFYGATNSQKIQAKLLSFQNTNVSIKTSDCAPVGAAAKETGSTTSLTPI